MPCRILLLTACLLATAACRHPEPPSQQNQADGYYMRGTAAYLAGDTQGALEAFERVRALAPDDRRLPTAEGEVLLSAGRLKDAKVRFEEALKMDPSRGPTWARLGLIHETLREDEEAKKALDRAIELYADDFQALETLGRLEARRGNVDAAVDAYVRAALAIPTGGAELMLMASDILHSAGRRDEALAVLSDAVVRNVVSGPLLRILGDLQVQSGQLREAIKSYEVAAKLSPRDPIPWELVGEIWARLDRPAEARAAFRESLRVRKRAVVHVAVVRLEMAQGDREAAEAALEAAKESLDGSVEDVLAIAEGLELLGRTEEALRVRRRLAEEPEQAGNVELQQGVVRAAGKAGDQSLVKEACARILAADAGVTACP